MATNNGSFPYFADGDVMVVLSETPQDTFTLHINTLAKDSGFFRASLQKLAWSQNKYLKEEGGDCEMDMKLLVLDLDGSDDFPLLVGSTIEPSLEEMKTRRKHHEQCAKYRSNHGSLTGRKYSSEGITVAAYKIGFALLYDLRIDLPFGHADSSLNIKKASFIIPAVVDFLDAYGLLPAYNDQVISTIFGQKWCGYDLIGQNPFRMLLVACKLQSQSIYQEAMKHAVGLRELFGPDQTDTYYSDTFLLDIGEAELHEHLVRHTKELQSDLADLQHDLFQLALINTHHRGITYHIGIAIWRDWLITHIGAPGYDHSGFIKLASKEYNVSQIVGDWSTKGWEDSIGVRVADIHRVVEGCFQEAGECFQRLFDSVGGPKGKQLHECDSEFEKKNGKQYFCYVVFEDDHGYPWAKAPPLPSYTLGPQL